MTDNNNKMTDEQLAEWNASHPGANLKRITDHELRQEIVDEVAKHLLTAMETNEFIQIYINGELKHVINNRKPV